RPLLHGKEEALLVRGGDHAVEGEEEDIRVVTDRAREERKELLAALLCGCGEGVDPLPQRVGFLPLDQRLRQRLEEAAVLARVGVAAAVDGVGEPLSSLATAKAPARRVDGARILRSEERRV